DLGKGAFACGFAKPKVSNLKDTVARENLAELGVCFLALLVGELRGIVRFVAQIPRFLAILGVGDKIEFTLLPLRFVALLVESGRLDGEVVVAVHGLADCSNAVDRRQG